MTNFIKYNGHMMPVKKVIILKAEEKAKAEIKSKAKAETEVKTKVTKNETVIEKAK